MTQKTGEEMREIRLSLGLKSWQMAKACGIAHGSMIRRIETEQVNVGGATSMVVDILTGELDPSNPDHRAKYEKALSHLGGPTKLLIQLLTGDIDREKHLASIPSKRESGAGQ